MPERPTVLIGIAVVEHAGQYLVGVRGDDGPLPGKAEFPGGKCRAGEMPRDCAVRECLEETGLQEALIIFQGGDESNSAVQDLILKIRVAGEIDSFAWIVPFPQQPKVRKADAKLFQEVFNYVEARRRRRSSKDGKTGSKGAERAPAAAGVRVISRKVVGSYDVAIVQETKPDALNGWLKENGYQPLADAGDVLKFYREKKYVFACIKVDETQLKKSKVVDLHPLRFTFKTGGRDGIYFPMKLTGLQSQPFDVNLYVLYRYWLNDALSKFGYEHRGFRLKYRDWDSPQCEANGGKAYTAPGTDPFLKNYARLFPTLTELLQASYPGERFYLTNIAANGLKPQRVREWSDDLWMFPYYTDKARVPFDARPGGVAATGWPNQKVDESGRDPEAVNLGVPEFDPTTPLVIGLLAICVVMAAGGGVWWMWRNRDPRTDV
eukprot:g33069.t1